MMIGHKRCSALQHFQTGTGVPDAEIIGVQRATLRTSGLLLIAAGILLSLLTQIETCSDGLVYSSCAQSLDPSAVMLGSALAALGLFTLRKARK